MSDKQHSARTEQQIAKERQSHEKKRLVLKIVGAIIAVTGLVLTIVGMVDFFKSFSGSGVPQKFYLAIVGLPLLGIGLMMLSFGFRKDIAKFVKNDTVPIMQQVGEEMTPTIVGIGHALNNDSAITCPDCGEANDADSAFCKKCGKQLVKKCPYCGQSIDPDSEFCKSCGKKI